MRMENPNYLTYNTYLVTEILLDNITEPFYTIIFQNSNKIIKINSVNLIGETTL